MMERHIFTAFNSTFVVDSSFQFAKELGQGAHGCVVAAKHRKSGDSCAIKKITDISTKVHRAEDSFHNHNLTVTLQWKLTKSCLREIKSVRHSILYPFALVDSKIKTATSLPRSRECLFVTGLFSYLLLC